MATKLNISAYNQKIEVRLLTETVQPDGNTIKDFNTVRFSTWFANVTAASTSQQFAAGMSEKDTLYIIRYEYSSNRQIQISDHILWSGRTLLPIGDCIIEKAGNKKFFIQKAKYTSA